MGIAALHPFYMLPDMPDGQITKSLSSPARKKIPLRALPKSTLELPPSCPTEGCFANVTNAGQDAVDADAL